MAAMNSEIDHYLQQGYGRCPLGGTPDCKVHRWTDTLLKLRQIMHSCGLTEELKWRVPCYTYEGRNILLMSALKEYCTLSFFKGVLLKDRYGVLEKPGKNTRIARVLRFENVQQVDQLEDIVKAYVQEAIDVEKAGLKVRFEKENRPIPEELQWKFDENPDLKAAFEALTPGRQRGYILYFSAAKQSKTRVSRIEKYISKILDGKGFHDR